MEIEIAMSKVRLTKEQEEMRLQGLRILARIIARHYLTNPGLYPGDAAGNGGADHPEESIGEKEDAI